MEVTIEVPDELADHRRVLRHDVLLAQGEERIDVATPKVKKMRRAQLEIDERDGSNSSTRSFTAHHTFKPELAASTPSGCRSP